MLPLLYSCKWSEHDDILKCSRGYGTTIDDDKSTAYTSISMCECTYELLIRLFLINFVFLFRVRVKLFNVVYIKWITIKQSMPECIIDYHGNIFWMNERKKLYVTEVWWNEKNCIKIKSVLSSIWLSKINNEEKRKKKSYAYSWSFDMQLNNNQYNWFYQLIKKF